MRQNLELKKYKGLTLLEMIVSIAIFALIATTIAIVFKSSVTVYQSASDESTAMQKGQVALGWLTRDISLATCIYEANPASLGLKNDKWGYVRYYLSDSSLMRTDCDSDQIVAQDVTNFNINYYDSANQSTSVICDIKTIEITLSVSLGDKTLDFYKVVAPKSCCQECEWAAGYSESIWDFALASDGYVLGAETSHFGAGGTDSFLIKTDSSGTIEWVKAYGDSSTDSFRGVMRTLDEGYIIAGESWAGAGIDDVSLVKTDSSGSLEWAKAYGGGGIDAMWQEVIDCLPSDGGYITGGFTYSFGTGNFDCFAVKTDSSGEAEWAKVVGGASDYDLFHTVEYSATDGGYLFGGKTNSFPGTVFLVKFDSTGVVTWAKTYGGATLYDYWQALKQTSDGGYILGSDSTVLKIDSSGEIEWAKTYQNPDARIWAIQQISAGYIFAGTASLPDSSWNFFVIQVDASGAVEWAKAYGGSAADYGYVLQEDSEGGYVVVGSTASYPGCSGLLIKTDSSGDIDCCVALLGEYSNDGDDANDDFTPTVTDVAASIAISRYDDSAEDDFTPLIFEWPDTSILPDFTLITTNLIAQGLTENNGSVTRTAICPSP